MMIASFFLIDVGSGEAGQDVKAMSEDIDKDLQKLTNETKDKCASLESCLAQIEHYQKVEKNIFGGRGWAMLQTIKDYGFESWNLDKATKMNNYIGHRITI